METIQTWQHDADNYQPALMQDLLPFLAINSVNDPLTATTLEPFGAGIEEALTFLENLAHRDDFVVKRYAQNMVVVVEYGPQDAEETVAVLAHADVVRGDAERWTITQPFEPKIVGDRLYARGAHDMKADLMASYYALRQLRDQQPHLKRKIQLIFGSDEEMEWRDMRQYLQENPEPTMGFSPDGAFPVVPGEKGYLTLSIDFVGTNAGEWVLETFKSGDSDNVVPGEAEAVVTIADHVERENFIMAYAKYIQATPLISGTAKPDGDAVHLLLIGKAAHGAYPEDGINAGTYLAHFLNSQPFGGQAHAFLEFIGESNHQNVYAEKLGLMYHDELMGDLTMNIGRMAFTAGQNSDIHVNFRYPTGITETAIVTQVQRHLGGLKAKLYKHKIYSNEPHLVPLDDPIVTILAEVYANQTNSTRQHKISKGGSYARLLKRGVAFGGQFPDVPITSHQPDEYVIISNISRAQAIFAEALYRLATV
ncbi:MAG: dipeptidase PepV [Lactobacillaceae bacterium]|jgi:predicted dipeptidase|nr:dipeptidase PepV [Lactobacillaceae bacterium]